MKKIRFDGVNAGSATLLVIFMTLCLTMLGLLSVASSNAERKLTEKMTDSVKNYYEADSKAQKIICYIDTNLVDIYSEISNGKHQKNNFDFLLQERIGENSDINLSFSEENNETVVSYGIPQGTTCTLQVKLRVPFDPLAKKRYIIEEYRIVQKEQSGYEEDSLDLWDGTIPE